jgi:hypothetical protein
MWASWARWVPALVRCLHLSLAECWILSVVMARRCRTLQCWYLVLLQVRYRSPVTSLAAMHSLLSSVRRRFASFGGLLRQRCRVDMHGCAGVSCTQFFRHVVPSVLWLGGATAVSLSIVAMHVTKTLHPPGTARRRIILHLEIALSFIRVRTSSVLMAPRRILHDRSRRNGADRGPRSDGRMESEVSLHCAASSSGRRCDGCHGHCGGQHVEAYDVPVALALAGLCTGVACSASSCKQPLSVEAMIR